MDIHSETSTETHRKIKVKKDLLKASSPTHQPQESILNLDKVNFFLIFTSDLLTHADLNNKQSSTLFVYTMFLRSNKLCNVLLYE